jgi:serine/threonine protein phosphatase PrpC
MEFYGYGATDVGKVREKNEDSLFVDNERRLYLVADGMGGHAGGAYASNRAIEVLTEELIQLEKSQDTTHPSLGGEEQKTPVQVRLQHAFKKANEDLINTSLQNSRLRGMGTTMTAIQFDGHYVNVAHIGDSRAYLIRDENIRQLTEDHSWVQEQVKAGLLTEEEARFHPLKNIITRSMGHERDVKVALSKEEYNPGDKYLLCSDGLTNMVNDDEMLAIVKERDVEGAVNKLVERALEEGGYDNITVVIVEVRD